MLIKKKPIDETKINFPTLGGKSLKKPDDAAEDVNKAAQQKGSNKGSKKIKKAGKSNYFAKKAATALAAKG